MFYTKDWAFFHIPKTSGTNLRICTEQQRPDFISILNMNMQYWHLLMHKPLRWWIESRLIEPGIPIITFVRNPYARAVSFWKFATKFKNVEMPFYDFFHDESNLFYGVRRWGFDQSWPQNKFIEDFPVEIFRIEDDLTYLEKRLKVNFLGTKHLASTYTKPYQDYYDTKTEKLIYKLYESDFDLYKYSKKLK